MTTVRTRRPPPPFRRVEVARLRPRSSRLVRVTLVGSELAGLELGLPAGSVRLLLPAPGAADVELPTWTGNEFLADDGSRPAIRTLTPVHLDTERDELDVEIVRHGAGRLSDWVEATTPGARVAVSGTGRGYTVDSTAPSFLLAGDETALPAIGVLLAALPVEADVRVLVEIAEADAGIDLPDHPGASVRWLGQSAGAPPGDALVAAAEDVPLAPDTRVWAAGEAASMQKLRRLLFEERGLPKSQAVVRGYWKHGRQGGDLDD